MIMHIAVYYSGRCDGYEFCLEKLYNKFYKKYKIDFYWSIDQDNETLYYKELRNKLNPIAVNYQKIDKQIIDVPLSSQETRNRNLLSMFYHNYKCTQMIKNSNIAYDVVVKFRAEIDSDDEFDIPNNLINNTIYIPNGYNYRGVCDRIAFGTLESMLIYGELYLNIHNYVYVKQALFNPEYLLMFHINEKNMNLIRFTYNYALHPNRHLIKSKVEHQC